MAAPREPPGSGAMACDCEFRPKARGSTVADRIQNQTPLPRGEARELLHTAGGVLHNTGRVAQRIKPSGQGGVADVVKCSLQFLRRACLGLRWCKIAQTGKR